MDKDVNFEEVKGVLHLLKALYDEKGTRKGLEKLEKTHPFDVVEEVKLEGINSVKQSIKLYRSALLHDVVEDFDVTLDDLNKVRGVNEEVVEMVRKLSRNLASSNEDYWVGVFSNKDVLRVKLADRIANLKDLINWVKGAKLFPENSLEIYKKYQNELEIIKTKFSDLKEADEHLNDLKEKIEGLLDELEEFYKNK